MDLLQCLGVSFMSNLLCTHLFVPPLQQYLQQQQPLGSPYPQASAGLGRTQSPQQPMVPPGEGRGQCLLQSAMHGILMMTTVAVQASGIL